MRKYILRRIFYGITVLIGVATIIFLLFNLLPGDPARLMLGNRPSQEAIEAINRDLGRDKSLGVQYMLYMNDISPISYHQSANPEESFFLDEEKYESYFNLIHIGDKHVVLKYPYLRRSYKARRKINDLILEALPQTSVLAIVSMSFAMFFGVLFGIIAATNKGTRWDALVLIVAVLGMALPSYYSGYIFQTVFAYHWGDYTGLPITGSLYGWDDALGRDSLQLMALVLPAFTLGIRPLAIVMQLTRNSLLEVLDQDYIRTAKAKGLSFFKILFKHALKNALNPVITAISGWIASLLAGAIFIEKVFNYKGLGMELFDSVMNNDLPVAMGIVLFLSFVFVIVNILVDIIYVLMDPRIRLK